jgi:hypothetical protein
LRISPWHALVFSLVYIALCSAAIPGIKKIPEKFLKRRYVFFLIAAFAAVSLVAFRLINVETLRVDRWSVITTFLDNLFQGRYPYLAKSFLGNQPGPFPFYYIVALPFYLVREIGLLTLTVFLLFSAFLHKLSRDNKVVMLQTVLLVSSPAVVYEVIVRSTIFANVGLVILYVFWLEKKILSGKQKQVLLPGLIGGLLLSTRAIVAIPVLCYLSYALLREKDFTRYFKIGAAMVAGFCLTFAPLLFWGWNSFIQNNPILLQANMTPTGVTIGFLIISFFGGLFLKSFTGYLYMCGIILFCILATSMIWYVYTFGWHRSFFGSEFDISYFVFCIPFLIASLHDLNGFKPQSELLPGPKHRN